jgi:hypothetical protein
MMNEMKISRSNIQTRMLLLGFGLLIIILINPVHVDAIDVLDPVDPYFIKEGQIPEGESLEIYYWLEKGKSYHIFMVGDWVEDNQSRTDYDIFTYYPSNLNTIKTTHTEAAALPEQVANDDKHQYYVPEETGAHKFRILNDDENGEGNKAAIFHVIEHVSLNTPVKRYIKGYNILGPSEKRELSVWAYQFRTRALDFEVYVDVSDFLDMYELRVYPMANIGNNVGYDLNGIATPRGDLYNTSSGAGFGGFNTMIDGFRDAIASAEYSGRDMRLGFRKGENVSDNEPTYYFLVLIGEWGEGTVEFFIKTDYSPPNITMIAPPIVGYTTEETLLKIDVESKNRIDRVWVNYTSDNWNNQETLEFREKDGFYQVDLPPFELHDIVNYEIFVKDVVDNENNLEGSFPVYNRATINLGISSSEIKGGQALKIIGSISKGKSDLVLNITSDDVLEEIEITTEQDGEFSHDFMPTLEGDYQLVVVFAGDNDYYASTSETKAFSVKKQELEVHSQIETQEIKKQFPVTVKGSITPKIPQVVLDIIFISSGNSFVQNVTTDPNGEFVTTITPKEDGEWQVLPQVQETNLLASSQGELLSFMVQKPTFFDILYLRAIVLVSPPWIYGLIGIVLIGIGGFEFRTGIIRRTIRGEPDESDEEEYMSARDDATSYRRRSNR